MSTSRYTEHHTTGYSQSDIHPQADEHYHSTFFCRALYDYQSQDPSSLSFIRGDVIEVLTQLESGWWDGLLNDERGWFPSNYVERISDTDAEAYFMRSASESSSMQSDSQSSTAFDDGSTLDNGQEWNHGISRQSQTPNETHRVVVPSGSTSNDFWVPRMTPSAQIYYVNTQTGERSRDLPSENDDDSAYPNHLQSLSSESPLGSVPTALRAKASEVESLATSSDFSRQDYAGFGIPKRSGTPEPWVRRLADDGTSYCYVNKIDGRVVLNRPVANSAIASSMTTSISSINGPASLSSVYGQLPNTAGDTYEIPQRMRSDSATSQQKGSSTSSRRISVYSDDSDVQPPFLKPSSQPPRSFERGAFQQESNSWNNIESTMPDGVEEEPIEMTVAERAAQKLQETITAAPGESLDELAEAVYITIDDVIRSVDSTELSSDQDRATEVEGLVSAVVESIRNLLYTSCALSGPLPSYMERDSLSHSLPSAAIQQLQAHLKTSQRKVTATLSKLVLSARAAYFKRESLSNDMMIRVQQDADDLQRAVHGFVIEAQKQYSKTAVPEGNTSLGRKRLRGAYSVTQLGLGLPGGGAGASWKGLGYIVFRDMTHPPRRQLSHEVFASLKECRDSLGEVGVLLQAKTFSLNDFVSLLLKLFSDMSSFLLLVADIHLSQYLDVDGVHRDAQEPYKEHVRKAQKSLRFFEVLIQSIYDDTAETFTSLQEKAFGFWTESDCYCDKTLQSYILSSQSKIDKAIFMVEEFLTIAHDQENEARNDYRESIGWRIDHTQPEGTLPLSSLFPPGDPEPEDAVDIEYVLSGPPRAQVDISELKQDPEPGNSIEPLDHHNPPHPDDLDDGQYPDDELFENKSKAPPRATKIRKFFGDDAPENYIESANADSKPWYLRADHRPEEITVNPDGKVIAGTLSALVERLTAHESGGSNPIFHKTFLMTYKSFTTLNELFDLLVKRYRIQPPDGLKPKELEEWKNAKQYHIRLRVINTFKSMLTDEDVLDKDDMYILDSIKDFLSAPDVASLSAAKNLLVVVERARNGGDAVIKSTASNPSSMPPSIVPKAGKKFKFLDVDPLEMARQLTLYESRLYNKITAIECLTRAREQKVGEHQDHIADIIQVTNKIANWVADTILSKEDSRKRANIVKHFISIADKCRTLHNFSSMVAITSGLNSPPIRRLKRTWEHIGSRHMSLLGTCERTFDTGKNFNNYRATLAKVNPPCVPFIGVYLSTLTFIQDGSKDILSGNLINFSKRQKAAEVIREIKHWQSKPFSLHPLPQVQAFIEDRLNSFNDSTDWSEAFWNKSLECEPREREDEKMARLLQESGFL